MNSITYQPTGVYSQFVKNPSLLNQTGAGEGVRAQNQTQAAPQNEPVKKNKSKALKAAKIGIVAAAAIGIFAFANYYKNGMKAINLRKEVLKGVTTTEGLKEHISERPYSKNEIIGFKKIWDDSHKYENNIVGKFNRGIHSVSEFFRRNFYNY